MGSFYSNDLNIIRQHIDIKYVYLLINTERILSSVYAAALVSFARLTLTMLKEFTMWAFSTVNSLIGLLIIHRG